MIAPRPVIAPSGSVHYVVGDKCLTCGDSVTHTGWPQVGCPCAGDVGHYFVRLAGDFVRWRCRRCGFVPPVREHRGQLALFSRNLP